MKIQKIAAQDLRAIVDQLPAMELLYEETRNSFLKNNDKLFLPSTHKPAWYKLYEYPYAEHARMAAEMTGQNDKAEVLRSSDNQVLEAGEMIRREFAQLNSDADDEVSDIESELMPIYFGIGLSLYLTLKSLLIFGNYLNDFVREVREEGPDADKVLLKALKIDPSVLCCPSVSTRISKAVIQNDKAFFESIRKSINAKLTKRQQRTYQNQRLVLQILHESGAPKLSDKELYQLFVEQLKIVARDQKGDGADITNNLRQFAYQFIKQKSVSENV